MKRTVTAALIGAIAMMAHDTYLMPAKFMVKSGKPLLVSVHNGDSFPASEHATDPARLKTSLTDMRIAGRATHGIAEVTKPGSFYITAETVPKRIVLEPDKFDAYVREEGMQHIVPARKQKNQTELYRKFAKALVTADAPDRGYATPAGLTIEIVPEADPSAIRPGASLPVQVLFKGKPAADLQVERAWANAGKSDRKIVGRTDNNGRIAIPVDSEGRWRLHAVQMQASTTPEADWESFWASLTFEITQ
jgi:uncharacterized GH25 family protein